jgi:branched-subunit amino acid transport protein AzlD
MVQIWMFSWCCLLVSEVSFQLLLRFRFWPSVVVVVCDLKQRFWRWFGGVYSHWGFGSLEVCCYSSAPLVIVQRRHPFFQLRSPLFCSSLDRQFDPFFLVLVLVVCLRTVLIDSLVSGVVAVVVFTASGAGSFFFAGVFLPVGLTVVVF